MFLTVPVTHRSTVVYKGGRKDYDHIFGEMVEVHVAEVDPADAPVALRWSTTDKTDPDGMRETRWFDGSHWTPLVRKNTIDPAVHVGIEDLVRRLDKGEERTLSVGHAHIIRDMISGRFKSSLDSDVREVKVDGRGPAIEQAHANAAATMIVDGMVWTRAAEPIYVMRPGANVVWVEVVASDSPKLKPGASLQRTNCFRLDRIEDLEDHVARTWPGSEVIYEETVDVLMPESLRYDDETPALLQHMRSALGWTSEKDVLSLPVTALVAWAGLRDALQSAQLDPSEDSVARLVDAARAHSQASYGEDGWQAVQIEAHLTRWSLRPVFETAPRADMTAG